MLKSVTEAVTAVAHAGVSNCGQSQQVRLRWLAVLAGALLLYGNASAQTSAPGKRIPRDRDQQKIRETSEGRETVTDWATDNLDMVSASAEQIRDVLTKDAGLMVELKRLMAKQAIDGGQIVMEEDLTDDAILRRLTTDTRFRALATRMLQRYGYLTPQINPLSPSGKEQDLVLKARAERLARMETEADVASPTRTVVAGCDTESTDERCSLENSSGARRLAQQKESQEGTEGLCDPDSDDAACTPGPPPRTLRPPSAPASSPDVEAPEVPRQDLTASLATASMVSGTDQSRSNPQGERGSMMRQTDLPDITGGMPSVLPENSSRELARTTVAPRQRRETFEAEGPEMVSSPNPYADLPSLYDLYMQAAQRVGRLKRFGLDVFVRQPQSTGVPMDLPAGPEYVLGPGDGLTIDLWGGVSQRLFRTVDREGRLLLPEVGPLLVSGKTLGEVQNVVQRTLRTQFQDVSADISLGRLRTVRVYVVGEVVSPGAYDISSLSTPLNALFAAGGVTSRGSLRHLRHSRGQQLVEEVDAYDLLLHGVRSDLKNLENGDTLLVPPVGPQVTLDGMVRRPAIYELRGETSLGQALELAGGVLPAAALRHIEVQRLQAHDQRTMLSVDLNDESDPNSVRRQLAAFRVQDGDEVHIFPIAAYNTAAVYLQGHVLRPGRYAYTPGMRLKDLIGSYRDLMPEPAEHYAEIISLRPPDWRPVVESIDLSAVLADPATSPKLSPLDTVRIFGRYDLESAPILWVSGEVRDPGRYRTSGRMHLRDAVYEAGGLLPDAEMNSAQVFRNTPDGAVQILNVNLAAALDADPLENILVQPRDRIVVHRNLRRVDPPSVYIRGEVANPGRYPLGGNMGVVDLLRAAGGPKRSADLEHSDLTRFDANQDRSSDGRHQRVDLAAMLHDPNLKLALHDADVLSVPELPGWKDRGASVTISGEVRNPGVYGIRPGEHLTSVLKRAGGLLPTAYPQGAIFLRNSVRELQEKSRQELIQRMEQESPTVKTSLTNSGGDQAQLAQQAAAQRERALDALRHAPVSGRMVVRLQAGLRGLQGSAQDIELRDGDSLEIPKRPGVVLVIGQVYNTNAITYTARKNARWYLSQSGGATRLGDKRNIFIVRADGEIVSSQEGVLWSESVLSTSIRPGDTIVVPEKTLVGDSNWKNIIAIAQIAEAAAITAAILP